jgi:tetratricopeptide (TPR) repeat protein
VPEGVTTTIKRGRRTVVVPAPKLLDARVLYEAGKNRDAYNLLQAFGDFSEFAGNETRLLAGYLARQLGAPRLGRSIHLRVWRSSPLNAEAQAAGFSALAEGRDLFSVWKQLREAEVPDGPKAGASAQQLWLLRARIAAGFHDFDLADRCWQSAEKITPPHPSVHVTRAVMLETEGRLEEALTAAVAAHEMRPWYPSAIRIGARILQSLHRDDEALGLLQSAANEAQDIPLLVDLANLQHALEQPQPLLATLDAISKVSPFPEKPILEWLLKLRAQTAWQIGDVDTAMSAAIELGDPYSIGFTRRAALAGEQRIRGQLPLSFVPADPETSSPSPIAALSAFWNQPVEPTRDWDDIMAVDVSRHDRQWAERHLWTAREFTVTWPAAVELLNRGVPFELFIFDDAVDRARIVIGYDEVRQALLVRDPKHRGLLEIPADVLNARQRVDGPAGLALTPADKSDLLQNLDLPESDLRDSLHRLRLAIERHDRDEAAFFVESLRGQAPDHPIALRAALELAEFDGDLSLALRWIDRLLDLCPEDQRLWLRKLDCLASSDQRDERLALLRNVCGRRGTPPLFSLRLADELRKDSRDFREAVFWARHALKQGAGLEAISRLAELRWEQRPSDDALELHRFAVCLNDKDETSARQYFHAARHLSDANRALDFFKARFERLGGRTGLPAIALFGAYDELGRRAEALPLLDTALQRRPDDGQLLLFAARTQIQTGQLAEAEKNLQAAEGRAPKSHVQRIAASLALCRNDLPRAQKLWREILDREPLALDANDEFARLLAEIEGRPAALKHLEEICARNPRHFGLCQLWLNWLEPDGPQVQEPIWRWLLELNPSDAATRRGWAKCLAGLRRWPEALKEAEAAIEADASNPAGHSLRGFILKSLGQFVEAQDAYRRAVSLAIDYKPAMAGLFDSCRTLLERRDALATVLTELERNLISGDGLLAFRDLGTNQLPPRELLAIFKKILGLRPDLWQAWAVVIGELARQGHLDEGVETATQAVERHPLSAPLWCEVASLYEIRKDAKSEIAALEQALSLNPGEVSILRRLASALDRGGQSDRARTELEETLRMHPRDADAWHQLGLLDWKQNQRQEAIEKLQRALAVDPECAPAWQSLTEWARTLKQPGLLLDTAKHIAQQRGNDPKASLRLARLLMEAKNPAEAMIALDHAIALHPKDVEAHDLRACLLASEDRIEEAFVACRPEAWTNPPPELRARAAWLLDQQGRRPEALEALAAVIDEAPHLVWAWEALTGWYLDIDKKAEARAVIDKFLKAAAAHTAPYIWLATWHERDGNNPEAIDLLEKVLVTDPRCVIARVNLMKIQLATNQFHALVDNAAALRELGFVDWALWGEIGRAVASKDTALATTQLLELCGIVESDGAALGMARDLFAEAKALGGIAPKLEKQLFSVPNHPSAGALWVESLWTRHKLPSTKKIRKLTERGDAGQQALLQTLRCLSEAGMKAASPRLITNAFRRGRLRRLGRKFNATLSRHPEAWSEFALALASNGRRGAARRWIGDWRNRKSPRPAWPGLFEAFCELKRDRDAMEIGLSALRDAPEKQKPSIAWRLAWLQVNHGEASLATALLCILRHVYAKDPAFAMLEGLANVRQVPEELRKKEAKKVFREVRKQLKGKHVGTSSAFLKRCIRQSAKGFARQGVGLRARIWGALVGRRLF